jgi:hypothetical protein
MRKHSKKKVRRPKGFSSPFLRPLAEKMLEIFEFPKQQKRSGYNNVSVVIIFMFAGVSGIAGYIGFGVPGGIVGLAVGAALTCYKMTRGRYYR